MKKNFQKAIFNFYVHLLLVVILQFSISCYAKESVAITNGILVDGTGGDPMLNMTVVINEDRIIAVDSSDDCVIPKNTTIISAKGGTILPGFINSHIHKGFMIHHLKTFARNGVTTVRDLGSPRFLLKDGPPQGVALARLVPAGPMFTTSDGYPPGPVRIEVNTVEEAIIKTNLIIDEGAKIIKIVIEDFLRGKSWSVLPKEIIETIVKTAHGRGIPVSAHAVRYRNLKIAVDAKVDDIAHIIIDYLPGDCINRMIQRDIYWIPTLEVFQCAVNDGRLPEYIFNEIALNNLQRFVLAGGKVALGTDFSGSQCNFDSGIPFTEIRLMQKSGMTPMQIIVAATKNAAHVCNLGTELGTIEIGKIADLIVVGGNPLVDLGVLSNLLVVIHNGNILYSKN